MDASPDRSAPRVLRVHAGGALLELPLAEVRAVLRPPPMTRPPGGGSPALLGVANVRGVATPVFSLAALASPMTTAAGTEARLVGRQDRARLVILERKGAFGLLVDAVAGVEAPQHAATATLDDMLRSVGERIAAAKERAVGEDRPQPRPAAQAETRVFASFWAAGQRVAAPLERLLAAVRRGPGLASAGDAVDYAGRRIPVVSCARALGMAHRAGHGGCIAVIDTGRGWLGLEVDRFGPVLRVSPASVDPAPAALAGGAVCAVARLDGGGLAAVLGVDRLAAASAQPLCEPTPAAAAPEPLAADAAAPERLLAFTVGGRRYAAPLARVENVLRATGALARPPRAPRGLAGVVNRRGVVTPVLALEGDAAAGWMVVLRLDGGPVALRVRSAPQLASATEESPPAAAGAGPFREVVKPGGERLRVLNPSAAGLGAEALAQAFAETAAP